MKRKILMFIISVFFALTALLLQFARNYPDACNTYAEVGIKGEISLEINKMLARKLNDNNINYSKIAKINTQSDGSISGINIEASKIDFIALELSNEIYNTLLSYNKSFGIPLANAMGSKLFSGNGDDRARIVQLGLRRLKRMSGEVRQMGLLTFRMAATSAAA